MAWPCVGRLKTTHWAARENVMYVFPCNFSFFRRFWWLNPPLAVIDDFFLQTRLPANPGYANVPRQALLLFAYATENFILLISLLF